MDSHPHLRFWAERAELAPKGEKLHVHSGARRGALSAQHATRNEQLATVCAAKAEGFLKQGMSVMGVTTVEGKAVYGPNKETKYS